MLSLTGSTCRLSPLDHRAYPEATEFLNSLIHGMMDSRLRPDGYVYQRHLHTYITVPVLPLQHLFIAPYIFSFFRPDLTSRAISLRHVAILITMMSCDEEATAVNTNPSSITAPFLQKIFKIFLEERLISSRLKTSARISGIATFTVGCCALQDHLKLTSSAMDRCLHRLVSPGANVARCVITLIAKKKEVGACTQA